MRMCIRLLLPTERGHADTPVRVLATLAVLLASLVLTSPALRSAEEVPVVKGELGPCTAEFKVTDSSNKPLYDAKIRVNMKYGFMSKRKTDLEVGTNAEGKARVEGLPEKVKKPLEFKIRYAGMQPKSVLDDPAINCKATYNVVLASP